MNLADRNIHAPQWPEFETVYSICGGNMFLLSKALDYWVVESPTPPVDWYQFPYVEQELSKLIKAEHPSHDLAMCAAGKSVPFWKTEDLYSVMRKVIKSGAVSYQTLCKQKGRHVIDSLLEHNIIHLRPIKHGSYDMGRSRIKGGVVTAESACGLYAMD